MKRHEATLHGKISNFLKSQIARIFKRKRNYFSVLIVGVILLLYGIREKVPISVSWEGRKLTVELKPKEDARPVGLVHAIKQPMVSRNLYERLQEKHDKLKKKFGDFTKNAIEISKLPPEVQGSPEEMVLKVGRLAEYDGTIWYSFAFIATEVARKVSINTNRDGEDEDSEEAFRCVQICLTKIGYYKGPLDGDWRKTNIAVLRFQKDFCPPVDGKVGIRTWLAMFIKISQEIYGKEQSG